MLLNAQQILATGDKKTREVDVPEWGKDAKVLVGSMGALAHARLQDWLDSHGNTPAIAEKEPADEEVISCDSPQPPDDVEASAAPAAEKVYTNVENAEVVLTWCVECILDPQTQKPAFSRYQLEELGWKDMAPLFRIYEAALDLSRASVESADAFEKNSPGTAG